MTPYEGTKNLTSKLWMRLTFTALLFAGVVRFMVLAWQK